jgi:hypothetical protein
MAERATMPVKIITGRMSPQEYAIRGQIAWDCTTVCSRCKVRPRSVIREVDGDVEAMCGDCDRRRMPPPIPRRPASRQSSPSASRSSEEQTRIDRRLDLMKKRLRLTLLGVR